MLELAGLIDSTSKHEHVESVTTKVLLDNHSQIDQQEHPPAQDKLPSTAADPTDTSGASAVVHTRWNHPAGHEVQSTSASTKPTTNQCLAAICSLAQPGTQEALQALLQASWQARPSQHPHLLSMTLLQQLQCLTCFHYRTC